MATIEGLFSKRFCSVDEFNFPSVYSFCDVVQGIIEKLDTSELDVFIRGFDEIRTPIAPLIEMFICRERDIRAARHEYGVDEDMSDLGDDCKENAP